MGTKPKRGENKKTEGYRAVKNAGSSLVEVVIAFLIIAFALASWTQILAAAGQLLAQTGESSERYTAFEREYYKTDSDALVRRQQSSALTLAACDADGEIRPGERVRLPLEGYALFRVAPESFGEEAGGLSVLRAERTADAAEAKNGAKVVSPSVQEEADEEE